MSPHAYEIGDRIADAALEYLGTPWHHQGRLKGVGVDCVGLLVCAAQEAGLEIDDVTNYPPEMAGTWLLDQLAERCDRLEKAGPYLRGDVLAFLFEGQPWHVALITQPDPVRIVHSWATAGKVVEQHLHGSWDRRIHSAWRVRV